MKGENEAKVVVEISVSSGIGKVFRKIITSYGETYRFHVSFSFNQKKWLIKDAVWEWVSIDELYPESLKVMKKLFPNTF